MTPSGDPAASASNAPIPVDGELVARIERALLQFVDGAGLPANLHAACTHALLAGGKRLRPLLVLECARAIDTEAERDAMPAAIAIELVHAFSLVHDDLPALDNDSMRRGKPTCHVAFGEAMAILAGDCLLALAPLSAGRSPRAAEAIQGELMRATVAMINGQVLDTLGGFPADASERARLEAIHRNKTGALIECSCRMGALAAGAGDAALASLGEFGQAIGLMFQIVDDLIDATQSAEHAGKATGKDADAGKLTYPQVHGIEGSRREVERLRILALDSLAAAGARPERLAALVDYLAARTR